MSVARALQRSLEGPQLTRDEVAAIESMAATTFPGLERKLQELAGSSRKPEDADWGAVAAGVLGAMASVVASLGPHANRFFAAVIDAVNEDAVRVELTSDDVTRKLLMRRLEQALETLFEVTVMLWPVVAHLDAGALDLSGDAVDAMRARTLPPVVDELFSFQLAAFAGIEASELGIEHLQHWVGVAQGFANRFRVRVHEGSLLDAVRLELAREEARTSWENWTDEDVAVETAPWPESA